MFVTSRAYIAAYVTRDGSLIRELMHPNASDARHQSLAEATVLPGQTTQEHFHRQTEELYYVLSGRGVMFLNGEERTIEAGDTVLIPPLARHCVTNRGNEPLVFLCCCSPPYSHEDTVLLAHDEYA
jgi:mannose-6-phosphate isomerase-like protein (cupin superfamily)